MKHTLPFTVCLSPFFKFEREVKTLSLYLAGWTQEEIAEADEKVG